MDGGLEPPADQMGNAHREVSAAEEVVIRQSVTPQRSSPGGAQAASFRVFGRPFRPLHDAGECVSICPDVSRCGPCGLGPLRGRGNKKEKWEDVCRERPQHANLRP